MMKAGSILALLFSLLICNDAAAEVPRRIEDLKTSLEEAAKKAAVPEEVLDLPAAAKFEAALMEEIKSGSSTPAAIDVLKLSGPESAAWQMAARSMLKAVSISDGRARIGDLSREAFNATLRPKDRKRHPARL